MASPRRFSADIRGAMNQASENMEDAAAGALFQLTRKVIMRTPVGDPSEWQNPPPPGYVGGTARGNWQATVDSPATGELATIDQSGQDTLREASETIAVAIGRVYYLTNNVPYIQRLEFEGWSKQAPQGMVRISMREMGLVFNEEATRVRNRR